MNSIKKCTVLALLAFSNLSFSAIVKMTNKLMLPLEVTIHYGSAGKTKSVIIPAQKSKKFNSGTHALKSLVWNKSGEGVFHSLYTPSSRFMLSGYIEIYPEGYFIKNFTRKGVINNGLVVYGNASSEMGKTPLHNGGKKTMLSIAQDTIERHLSAMKKLKNISSLDLTEYDDFSEPIESDESVETE